MIDICNSAVGLSRQLYGLTMHSERPGHRMPLISFTGSTEIGRHVSKVVAGRFG
jgi:acyl-CoA reductase-like NAD-dependent aldehyde dehydrogenase